MISESFIERAFRAFEENPLTMLNFLILITIFGYIWYAIYRDFLRAKALRIGNGQLEQSLGKILNLMEEITRTNQAMLHSIEDILRSRNLEDDWQNSQAWLDLMNTLRGNKEILMKLNTMISALFSRAFGKGPITPN
jgi:hypothetical protein